jgi:hypothetical protein
VFEFDCVAGTFEVGKLVGADVLVGGTALENQLATPVTTANLAIGRCAKRVNPAGTRVLVDVVSSMQKGGPQAIL